MQDKEIKSYNPNLIKKNKSIEENESILSDFKLKSDELTEIIIRWKKDSYPDTPDINGMIQSLKRCYDGQYDPNIANRIVKNIFSEDK